MILFDIKSFKVHLYAGNTVPANQLCKTNILNSVDEEKFNL